MAVDTRRQPAPARNGYYRQGTRGNVTPFPQQRPAAQERVTPQSTDAEQSTLGAMMMDSEAIVFAAANLEQTDFYRELHRKIFHVIITLHERGDGVDYVTVVEELRRRDEYSDDVPAYCAHLIEACAGSANVKTYVKDVLKASVRRQTLRELEEMQVAVYGDNEGFLDRAVDSFQKLRERTLKGGELPIINASQLLQQQLPEPKWVVPGLIPEGLTVLAGKPKQGKSWLALGLALAAAYGGTALGQYEVEAGDVLYLALEDQHRRLQNRIRQVIAGSEAPERLDLAVTWNAQDEGGLEMVERWLATHPEARLVVIDTLEKFRPRREAGGNAYTEDYEHMGGIKRLADAYGVAIIVIHHVNKQEQSDPVAAVNSSYGLTGAADSILVLTRKRNTTEGELFITGRDVNEGRLVMRFDDQLGMWNAEGDTQTGHQSRERRDVIDLLLEAGEVLEPRVMAEMLDKKPGTIRRLLMSMKNDGEIEKIGDGYRPAKHILDAADGIQGSDVFDGETCERLNKTAGVTVTALPALPALPTKYTNNSGNAGNGNALAKNFRPTKEQQVEEEAIVQHAVAHNYSPFQARCFVRDWRDHYTAPCTVASFDRYFEIWNATGVIEEAHPP